MSFLFLLLMFSETSLKLSSSAFNNNGNIPQKYTCQGQSVNPPLAISEVPKATKSLVLIVDDPDADSGLFDHWVVWNISPSTTMIAENSKPGTEGKNGKNQIGYTGPCPPTGVHHYHFQVYAIDKMLDLKPGASRADVTKAIEGHILSGGEMIGLYQKSK